MHPTPHSRRVLVCLLSVFPLACAPEDVKQAVPAVAVAPCSESAPALAVAPFNELQARGHQESWATYLAQPVEITNSVGMKLRLIPPGDFMMGSPESEPNRFFNEGPQRRTRITRPFYLGVYEVTQSQFERLMGSNPSAFSQAGHDSDRVSGQDTSRFPVEMVSWEEAVEFCRRLSAISEERAAGRVYRLPTEAEWEYACRAGTTTPFHFGSVLDGREANCDGRYPYGTSDPGPYLERPTTVGSYSANRFGLYDMHGNVWEWVSDWYAYDYYAQSASVDPAGPVSGADRVLRGGGWGMRPCICRSAARYRSPPERRVDSLGFRVALVLVPAEITQEKEKEEKDRHYPGGPLESFSPR